MKTVGEAQRRKLLMSEQDKRIALTYTELPNDLKRGGPMSWLRLFGPGAIISSVTIGSGETLFASRAGAIFGYSLLWFIVIAALCKAVQVYIGARYITLTGEHPAEAWARLPGPRSWFPAMLGFLSVVCMPFWLGALSIILGTTLNWVLCLDAHPEQTQLLYARGFATAILFLAVALTLVQSYQVLEKVQTGIIAILLLAVFASVVVSPAEWMAVIRGLFHVQLPVYPEWMPAKYPEVIERESAFVALVVFMSAIGGGTYDYIGYLSFYRDKQWGALASAKIESAGPPAIDESAANVAIGRSWLRAPIADVFVGFGCMLVFTLAFNILGAAILHPEQLVPEKFDLLTYQAQFFTQFGQGFKYLYQLGILMAIWGTVYGAFEIYTRTVYECARAVFPSVRHWPLRKMRLIVCLYAGLGGLVLAWTRENPLAIIGTIGPIATVTCGLWCFAMVWINRKSLPKVLQMNRGLLALNIIAGIVLTGFGIRAFF